MFKFSGNRTCITFKLVNWMDKICINSVVIHNLMIMLFFNDNNSTSRDCFTFFKCIKQMIHIGEDEIYINNGLVDLFLIKAIYWRRAQKRFRSCLVSNSN